jgi:hypothetical protein
MTTCTHAVTACADDGQRGAACSTTTQRVPLAHRGLLSWLTVAVAGAAIAWALC